MTNRTHRRHSTRLLALSVGIVTASLWLSVPTHARKAPPALPSETVGPSAPAKKTKSHQGKSEQQSKTTATSTKPSEKAPAQEAAPAPEEFGNLTPQTLQQLQTLHDAIQMENKAVQNEVRDEEELAVKDIGMLWQAAVERSSTIRYAIEKLSRTDETGKPVQNDGFTRKMLQQAARLGGVAGSMMTGTPAGLLGGDMVGNLLSGDPQESALARVTDADMILLAKEVENLQSKVIELYYQYSHSRERWQLTQDATRTISRYYDNALSGGTQDAAMEPLMNSLYESAKQEEESARRAFSAARDALILVTGPDAVTALEQAHEQNGPTTPKSASAS